jgi:hypothetical protein
MLIQLIVPDTLVGPFFNLKTRYKSMNCRNAQHTFALL